MGGGDPVRMLAPKAVQAWHPAGSFSHCWTSQQWHTAKGDHGGEIESACLSRRAGPSMAHGKTLVGTVGSRDDKGT